MSYMFYRQLTLYGLVGMLLLTAGCHLLPVPAPPTPQAPPAATMSIHEAARCGLLDGEDVNARDAAGVTPLHMAALGGWLELAQLLLDQGALINARDKLSGGTPLIMAVMHGHTDVIELLLAQGADIDMATNRGTTALHAAVAVGRRDIVRRLLDHGADISLRDEKNCTPADWAQKFGREDMRLMLAPFEKAPTPAAD